MITERGVFLEEHDGFWNGIYERRMKTKFGGIDDLAVPRDRGGELQDCGVWALQQVCRSRRADHFPLFQGNIDQKGF
jgi:hypothetical protein